MSFNRGGISRRSFTLAGIAGFGMAMAGVAKAKDQCSTEWLKKWDGVKLVLSSHAGPTTDAVRKMVKEFERLTGAQVEVRGDPWQTLLSNHLNDFAAGGGGYDVLSWPYTWAGHYVEGGLIVKLNDYMKSDLADPAFGMDDIPAAAQDVYGHYKMSTSPDVNGLWALPYKFDIYMAMYRTDLFKEAGIVDAAGNAKPPDSYDELLAAAEKLRAKFPDIIPVAFPLAVDDPMVATFLPIYASYGAKGTIPFYDSNLYPSMASDTARQTVELLKKLIKYMPADVLDMDYDRVNQLFAQGRVAYAFNWNAYLPTVLSPSSSQVSDKVAFSPTPGGPAGRVSGLGGWAMGVSAASKHPEAAFQLIQWVGGQCRAVDLALAGGSIARYSVAQDPSVQKAFPFYPLLIKALDHYAARGMDRAWAELQRTIGVGLNKAVQAQDVSATLKETADTMFDEAKKAGYNPSATGPRP